MRYQNLNPISGGKGLYYYYVNCDVGKTTTITITNRNNASYQDFIALIFTRDALLAMHATCSEGGNFTGLSISAISGDNPLTSSYSNNVITLKIGLWQDFTMMLYKHNGSTELEVKSS